MRRRGDDNGDLGFGDILIQQLSFQSYRRSFSTYFLHISLLCHQWEHPYWSQNQCHLQRNRMTDCFSSIFLHYFLIYHHVLRLSTHCAASITRKYSNISPKDRRHRLQWSVCKPGSQKALLWQRKILMWRTASNETGWVINDLDAFKLTLKKKLPKLNPLDWNELWKYQTVLKSCMK